MTPRPDTAAAALALALGVALRAGSPSALWLDEAISASIASLPLHQVPAALQHDGSPPLYYLLLWGWVHALGDGTTAVRLLSALLGVLALPLAYLLGRRLGGARAGWAAVLVLATSRFAIRYATETRMYSLVVLLVLAGALALEALLRTGRRRYGVAVAVLSGALALTHYWCLFLLAAVGLGLAARRRWRPLAWTAAGGLLFLPWLPAFLVQLRHTGTPWGRPAPLGQALAVLVPWSGGTSTAARVLLALLVPALVVAVTLLDRQGSRLELDLRGRGPGRVLAGACFGSLLLGLLVGRLTGQAYADRYTSASFALFAVLAGLGLARLGTAVLAAVVALQLATSLPLAWDRSRTQAPALAAVLRRQALPGDLVVYCPDQLGPAMTRLLPPALHQEVYPTAGSPARVDWTDYARRNRVADPVAFASRVAQGTRGHALWLVENDGYRAAGSGCARLHRALDQLRETPGVTVVSQDRKRFERAALVLWPRA